MATSAAIIIPTGIHVGILKKQLKEKEQLYIKAITKQNALIKQLDASANLDMEKRDHLLMLDAQLKQKLLNKQDEIQKLKNKIAELEKEANGE